MRDVDHRDPEALLERADLAAHLVTEFGIQIGKGLVHQADRRFTDDGPAQRDALPLAPGQLRGFAAQQLSQSKEFRDAVHPAFPLRRIELSHLESENNVFLDVQMGEQGVRLENHGDVAFGGRQPGDIPPADADGAPRQGFETGNQAQDGGFSAAGRAEHHQQLASVGGTAYAIHRLDLAPGFGYVVQLNLHPTITPWSGFPGGTDGKLSQRFWERFAVLLNADGP